MKKPPLTKKNRRVVKDEVRPEKEEKKEIKKKQEGFSHILSKILLFCKFREQPLRHFPCDHAPQIADADRDGSREDAAKEQRKYKVRHAFRPNNPCLFSVRSFR